MFLFDTHTIRVTLTEYSSEEEEEEEESDEGQEDGPFNENNMDFGKFMQM